MVTDCDSVYWLRREIKDIVLANAGTMADLLLVGISTRMGGKNLTIPAAVTKPSGAANRAAPHGQYLQDVPTPAHTQLEPEGKTTMTTQQAPQPLADLINEVARLTAANAPYDELFPVKTAASAELWRHTDAVERGMVERVRADKHVQAVLVDLFLITHLAVDRDLHPRGLSSGVNWPAVLENFFPIPSDELIAAREASFRAEHGIPSLSQAGQQ